ECAEVPPDQNLLPLFGRHGRWTDLVLGDGEEIGAPLFPRAGRWDPDQRRPESDTNEVGRRQTELGDDLLPAFRAVREQRSGPTIDRTEPALFAPPLRVAEPPLPQRFVYRDHERPEVAPRDEVDRRAHQCGLYDRLAL